MELTREQRIAQKRAKGTPHYSNMRDVYLEFSAESFRRYQAAFCDTATALHKLGHEQSADKACWWAVPVYRIIGAIFNMLNAARHAQAEEVSIPDDETPARTWCGMYVVAVGDSVWIQWNDAESYEIMRWAIGWVAVEMGALEKAAGKDADSVRIVGKLMRVLQSPAAGLLGGGIKAPECGWPENA